MNVFKLRLYKEILNSITNSGQTVANVIQTLINREGFYEELLIFSNCSIEVFCYYLGLIIQYYIETRDKKSDYSIEELLERSNNSISEEMKYNNSIKNGFFTHSCNGLLRKKISENGLGNSQNYDYQLFENLEYLEQILGESPYLKQQTGKTNEIYFTSPGASSVGYAILNSPERLHLGILKQERDDSIPVIVGESKLDYYKKVAYKKLEMSDIETKKQIDYVLESFFSENPIITLFPIADIINNKNIYFEVVKDNNHIENIMSYIESQINGNTDFFFTHEVGSNSNPNNLDNMVMIDTVISPNRIGFIELLDQYELMQKIALIRGLKTGDNFDYFTGEKLENNKLV